MGGRHGGQADGGSAVTALLGYHVCICGNIEIYVWNLGDRLKTVSMTSANVWVSTTSKLMELISLINHLNQGTKFAVLFCYNTLIFLFIFNP